MERLLIELEVGDGYAYSGVATYPISCESKEKAISDLETILLTYQIDLEKNNQEKLVAYQNLIRIGKKLESTKDKNLIDENVQAQNEYIKVSKALSETFKLGNAEFNYSDFIHYNDNNKSNIYIPNIYTLDEYFAKVENKYNKKPSI